MESNQTSGAIPREVVKFAKSIAGEMRAGGVAIDGISTVGLTVNTSDGEAFIITINERMDKINIKPKRR